jgi:hypothetical protein
MLLYICHITATMKLNLDSEWQVILADEIEKPLLS